MKKTRFSEEQMVKILREADKASVSEVAKKHGVSEVTIYAWRKRFGQLEAADVKRRNAHCSGDPSRSRNPVISCQQSVELYRRIGYQPPWVSYIATDGNTGVGGGAFVGAPRDGVVEIAYFTLPEFMGRGYATLTARHLVGIARRAMPQIVLKAFTLQQGNVSTKILVRLGFERFGLAHDADAGESLGMENLCRRHIVRMNASDSPDS